MNPLRPVDGQVGGYVTSYGIVNTRGATVAATIGRRRGSSKSDITEKGSSGTLELAVVLNAGHSVPAYQPAGVSQLVRSWIK